MVLIPIFLISGAQFSSLCFYSFYDSYLSCWGKVEGKKNQQNYSKMKSTVHRPLDPMHSEGSLKRWMPDFYHHVMACDWALIFLKAPQMIQMCSAAGNHSGIPDKETSVPTNIAGLKITWNMPGGEEIERGESGLRRPWKFKAINIHKSCLF